jgi:hypothetical protein
MGSSHDHDHEHGHGHDHVHEHGQPVPEWSDTNNPDTEQSPGALSRRSLLRNAGLLGLGCDVPDRISGLSPPD